MKYTKDHEWIIVENDIATIGISDYALDALGDLVYVELPEIGRQVAKGEDFAVVESVKIASEIYTPVTGEVVEINEAIEVEAENLKNGTEDGWIAKIKLADTSELEQDLMDQSEYDQYIQGLEA